MEKVESMQKVLYNVQAEKKELQAKIEKLEQGKLRMEKILKQHLSQKSSSNNPNSELLEELMLLTKRIDYME
jgi:hypothetical protein